MSAQLAEFHGVPPRRMERRRSGGRHVGAYRIEYGVVSIAVIARTREMAPIWPGSRPLCHDPPRMLRNALIITICLAVAILGISGMHVHVPGPMASGQAHVHKAGMSYGVGKGVDDGHVLAVSAMQGDDDAEHGEHGDLDIEPMAKAFTKLSLSQIVPAVALICFLVTLLVRVATRVPALRRPRRRPLRRHLVLHFLPLSHAPPAATSSR